jgi:hypothetical protein
VLAEHHAAALTKIAAELIPAVEGLSPALRKKLAQTLLEQLPKISEHLRSDVPRALALLGARSPDQARPLGAIVEEIRAQRARELEDLQSALAGPQKLTLAALTASWTLQLREGMELPALWKEGLASPPGPPVSDPGLLEVASALSLGPQDLWRAIAGDTAFRALHYFLEVVQKVTGAVQPRSMLALRNTKP